MVVFVFVGEFDVTGLTFDVEVSFVSVVEAVGEGERVGFVDTPFDTYLGTDVREILSVMGCGAGV